MGHVEKLQGQPGLTAVFLWGDSYHSRSSVIRDAYKIIFIVSDRLNDRCRILVQLSLR